MQPKVFERADLVITNPFPRLPWEETKPEDRHTIHWGQRKLTLAEIEFFSLYWDPRKISKPLCVHVGDPGPGLDMLCQMFPTITWHIYYQGRQPHVVPPQVTFFNQSFTDKVATKYTHTAQAQDNIFFISDYRSTDYHVIESEIFRANGISLNQYGQPLGNKKLIKDLRRQAERANEEAIASDMRDQQRWFLIINPAHGLLKFRPPYALSRTDQGFAYLSGRVYWQAWARPTSTETRLKPTRDENGNYTVDSNLNALEYEEWCFYHNIVRREKGVYLNPLTGAVGPIDSPHLQADYDSALEAYILSLYWRRFAGVEDLSTSANLSMLVLSSSHYLTFVLNNQHPDPSTWTTLASKRSALTSARPVVDPFSPQSTPDTSRSVAESFSPPRLSENVEAESLESERLSEEKSSGSERALPSRPLSPPRASVPLLQPTMHSPFKRANNLQVIPDFSTQEDVVINLEDLGLKSSSSASVSVSSPPEEVQEEPLVAVARKPITLSAAPKGTGKVSKKAAKDVVLPEVTLPSVAAIPQRPLTNFPTGRAQTTVLEGLNEPSIRPQINIIPNAPTKAAPKVSTSSIPKVSASAPKVSVAEGSSVSSAVPKVSAVGSTPKSVPKMVPKSTAKAVPKMVPSKASAKTSAPPK